MTFEIRLMEERMKVREEALAEGRAEGEAIGEAKRAKDYVSLINDGILTLSDAVARSGLSEEDIKKYLEPVDSHLLYNT